MIREDALERVLRAALDWLDSHPDPRTRSFVVGVRAALDGEFPGGLLYPDLCSKHSGCGKDH